MNTLQTLVLQVLSLGGCIALLSMLVHEHYRKGTEVGE